MLTKGVNAVIKPDLFVRQNMSPEDTFVSNEAKEPNVITDLSPSKFVAQLLPNSEISTSIICQGVSVKFLTKWYCQIVCSDPWFKLTSQSKILEVPEPISADKLCVCPTKILSPAVKALTGYGTRVEITSNCYIAQYEVYLCLKYI